MGTDSLTGAPPVTFGSDVTKGPRFEGGVDALKGHIYGCSSPRADHYIKTTREIAKYVGLTYENGDDVKRAIESLTDTTFTKPADPIAGATMTQTRLSEIYVNKYIERKEIYSKNMKSAYSLVWGQCTNAFQAKLELWDDHSHIALNRDVLGLLRNIKEEAALDFRSQKRPIQALFEAKRRFYTFSQDRSMTCHAYLEQFKNLVECIELCGGSMVDSAMLTRALEAAGVDHNTATAKQLEEATTKAREEYLACA